MWNVEPARAILDIRQDGEVLRVSVTRDATAEERLLAIGMLAAASILLVLAREAPWQLLFFLIAAIGVLLFQVFFGTAIYRSSLVASLEGLTFRQDSGLFKRRSRLMPAVEVKNLLYGSDGEADPGLCVKRDNRPDVCVLPYIDEAQAVGLRKLIFEYLALTPGNVTISRSEFFR